MKMKKKKKTNEPIIINQEPLSTTTIGKIEIKDNGPIFAIVGIAIFVICNSAAVQSEYIQAKYRKGFLRQSDLPMKTLKKSLNFLFKPSNTELRPMAVLQSV